MRLSALTLLLFALAACSDDPVYNAPVIDDQQDAEMSPDTSEEDASEPRPDIEAMPDTTPEPDAPSPEDVPTEEDVPVEEDTPSQDDVPPQEDVPTPEDVPAEEDVPNQADVPGEEDVPTPEDVPVCQSDLQITLAQTERDIFFWEGNGASLEEIAFERAGEGCEPLSARTDADWLRASVDEDRGRVAVWLDVAAVLSGRHEGRVTLHEGTQDEALATITVRLKALRSGPPGAARKTLVIGVDGMRSDGFAVAPTPNFEGLLPYAAWTLEASTQLEGVTLSGPGWTSIVTGVDVDKHNVTGNGGFGNRNLDYPSYLWRLRHQHGLRTAAAIHWTPILNDILEDDALTEGAAGNDAEVTDTLADMITRDESFDSFFIHLDDVDHAGHSTGFSPDNPVYLQAIATIDTQFGQLFEAILDRPTLPDEEWLIIMTTDHGGEGTGHGPIEPPYRRIPFVAVGPSVQPGALGGFVSHMDAAPTVMAFHGLHPDDTFDLDGQVVGLDIEARCGDRIDEDGDGDTDCDDEDCARSSLCGFLPDETICNDGLDNDRDEAVDCLDDDCSDDPICNLACEASDLGQATGTLVDGVNNSEGENLRRGSCGGDEAPELLFDWEAPEDDIYVIDTFDAAIDTVLYAREGDCRGPEIACSNRAFGSLRLDTPIPFQSALRLPLSAGDRLSIAIDGSNGLALGEVSLNITPVGGTCPDETLGSAIGPAVVSSSTTGQPTRYLASCAGSARDRTYTWTAPSAGTWTFDTLDADYDTIIVVLDGACGEEELACNDDAQGLQSRTTATLAEGQTVTIVVSGFRGRNGDFSLNISGP